MRKQSDKEYQARVWRSNHLKRQAEYDVETMVYALKGNHEIEIIQGDFPVTGYPFTRNDRFSVRMGQWFANGYTRAGALTKMLGLMLDEKYTPLT